MTKKSVDAVVNGSFTRLYCAVQDGKAQLVKDLLLQGANTEIRTWAGWTAIYLAALYKRVSIIEILVKEGVANVNALQGDNGEITLHDAAFSGDLPTIKKLLELGADPNHRDRNGNTPLHQCRNVYTSELLLEYGADPHIRNKFGYVPIELYPDWWVEQFKKNPKIKLKFKESKNKIEIFSYVEDLFG